MECQLLRSVSYYGVSVIKSSLHLTDFVLFQSRFAVNSVTSADYGRPFRIAAFVAELDAGFRLLNLKNDSLRKKFDGLKYDLKKIEEVVYDLTIRGLKPSSEEADRQEISDNKAGLDVGSPPGEK